MTPTYVGCQTFAGGLDCGVVQSGWELVHRVEQKGGFGLKNELANRHILGDDWDWQAGPAEEWEPMAVDAVFACPPCSGFSLLSRKDFRGADSVINSCMHDLAGYIIKCRPQIAVMESVQQAHKIGIGLMRDLRARIEWETGERYDLYHVLHNNASVGGCSIRRRYFWVITRVPFGIEREPVIKVPTLNDVIGDLEGLGNSWERQPYARPASWYSERYRSETGSVDGHVYSMTPYLRRALDLLPAAGPWATKEIISDVARRHYQLYGRLPDSWAATEDKLVAKDFMMGYNQLVRWNGEKIGRVITGGGCDLVMHPNEDRTLTHREVARIMGFPDDWRIRPLKGAPSLKLTWGKGVSVPCGRWIGRWAKAALEGNPGSYTGDAGEQDREWTINVTEDYRSASSER